MRNGSHNTFIARLRDTLEAWRKQNGWSRETLVMVIVEAHDQIDGPATTGIVFDPPTRDAFERVKVNADRVFRWLDDITKDTNTLPANFIPSVLRALPMDRRIALLNAWLCDFDVVCQPAQPDDDADTPQTLGVFTDLVRTSASAQASVADLLDGVDPGEIDKARVALSATLGSINRALHLIDHHIGAASGARP